MLVRSIVGIALAVGLTAVSVQAQVATRGDAIAERRDVMKGVGAATRTGTQMVRGEAPFDLEKAREVLRTYSEAAERMPHLFPAGTEAGGETTASPRVWQDKGGLDQRFADWGAHTGAAQVHDFDSFREAFGTATQACGACHEVYRIPRT